MMRNLRAEMERNGVNVRNIQDLIGKSDKSVRNKISGRSAFTLPEAIDIRDAFFCGMSLEYLFSTNRPNRAS